MMEEERRVCFGYMLRIDVKTVEHVMSRACYELSIYSELGIYY
jgi:hypothetical protein